MATLNLEGLAPGIYTLSVATDRGILVKKIVLE
jgi:hypothetical protein